MQLKVYYLIWLRWNEIDIIREYFAVIVQSTMRHREREYC